MLDSKYRGRRKGVPVREGSVRQARNEANLSLAQVADGKVSRTAIHLIETGRSQPSMETLEQIARQTRKPLDYFLAVPEPGPDVGQLDTELRDVERLTLIRDFQRVIEVGSALLEKQLGEQDTALVRFYVGQSCCRLVQPNEALYHLTLARAVFEKLGDEWMAVDCLDWESSALGLLEDPRAISLAHRALDRCRQLDPKPQQTEARILGHLANMYVVSHSWIQATRYYAAAVEAASGIKDLLQLAKMNHGLATAYQRMQQPVKARKHFDRALALYSIESDLSAIYRVENDLGDLLLHQGQLDSAEQHLRAALAGLDELGVDRRGRGYILANLGEVSLRRGRLQEATMYLTKAMEAGEAVGEAVVLANVHTLLGDVEERKGNPQRADEHFGLAIRTLEGLGMPDRLRDCHMEYAEVLSARPNITAAAQHWKSAAEIGKLAAIGSGWNRDEVEKGGEERLAAAGHGATA